MNDNELQWTIKSKKQLLRTPVYDVIEQHEVSETGIEGDYVAIDCRDWVMVIPEYEDSFVMVRQWRHSSEELTVEFPGGVTDEMRQRLTHLKGFRFSRHKYYNLPAPRLKIIEDFIQRRIAEIVDTPCRPCQGLNSGGTEMYTLK